MKHLIASTIFLLAVLVGYSQEKRKDSVSVRKRDTVLVITVDSTKASKPRKKSVSVNFNLGKKDSIEKAKPHHYPEFSLGLTLARIDLGFSRYLDNGSLKLSPKNDYLDYEGGKTSNFGFEFLQMGVRFSNTFKVYLATGLDWNHIRLEKNITIQKDLPLDQRTTDDIEYKKNRFSSRYLRVPLSFQFRSQENDKGKRIYFIVGPEIGFLLNGKVKQVSGDKVKTKVKNDYNFEPLRYGAFARFGYSDWGIYAKYYFNDVFVKDFGPSDFKNFSFGITCGF